MKRFGIQVGILLMLVLGLCSTSFADGRNKGGRTCPPRGNFHRPAPVVRYNFYRYDAPCVRYYAPVVPRCSCACDPCDCYPVCRCLSRRGASIEIRLDVNAEQEAQRRDCPDGKCPKPQYQQPPVPQLPATIEQDNQFVWRAYASSARLSHKASGGSATVVDCYRNRVGEWVAVLIGCNHVVDYRIDDKNPLKVELFWPEKLETKGYVIERDPANDLAIMSMRVPKQVPYIGVTKGGTPPTGARVLTIGCPALDKGQSDPVGYFTTVMNETYKNNEGKINFAMNYPAVGGHSGGGVFYDNSHAGVLVTRGNGQSQAVLPVYIRNLYEKVFCEGDLSKASTPDLISGVEQLGDEKPSCFFDFFRRRQPRPPYQGPPPGAPDLRPEEPPPVVQEPPSVPEQPPVVEEESLQVSPFVAGLILGFPAAIGAVIVCFYRKVKGTPALYS